MCSILSLVFSVGSSSNDVLEGVCLTDEKTTTTNTEAAEVQSLVRTERHIDRVVIDPRIVRNSSELVACVDAGAGDNRNFISDRVLRLEESIDLFRATDAELARKPFGAMSKPRILLSFCYCSISDETYLN